ncbi:MAG: PorT family protein [Sphingobacteriales bacterium]|nr:MAG: PorT family protein [Sphingobacteriales bacterium]
MKKALLTAVVSVGLSGNINAQSLHLGVTAGPQLTNMKGDVGKFKGIIGFNGGVSADWRIHNFFALGMDVVYSTAGATKEYLQPDVLYTIQNYYTYKTTDQFTYAKAVLLPKFILPLGSKPVIPYDNPGDQKLFLSFFAGPYYAQRLGFSSTGKYSGYTLAVPSEPGGDTLRKVPSTPYTSSSEDVKRVAPNDIGFLAGAGINFNINGGKTILGFEGRYSQSLMTVDLGYYRKEIPNYIATKNPVSGETTFQQSFKAPSKNTNVNILHNALAFNVTLKFRLAGD